MGDWDIDTDNVTDSGWRRIMRIGNRDNHDDPMAPLKGYFECFKLDDSAHIAGSLTFHANPESADCGLIEAGELRDFDGAYDLPTWVKVELNQYNIANDYVRADLKALFGGVPVPAGQMYGECDDGIACDKTDPKMLNEWGRCECCEEQREYEDDKFPLTDGDKDAYKELLQAVLDNADEADLNSEVYLDRAIITRIREMIE